MNPITAAVLFWYKQNARDLPWRQTKDPFKIWLSEIILQQTRVAQGLPYYLKFIEHFPTVKDLATAGEDEVLLLWQGLGYYSRARNLHRCARFIYEKHDGVFPNSYDGLIALPGIGPYTAAALASFAFNLPHPAIDGNLIRFISRLFGIYLPPNSPASFKEVSKIAQDLLEGAPASVFNQAMMEMGALICTPKVPHCAMCPVREHCFAYGKNEIAKLPILKAKTKVRDRHFYYLIIHSRGKFAIEQRKGKDIWENLYQFPLIETPQPLDAKGVEIEVKNLCSSLSVKSITKKQKHLLSHQRLHAHFVEVELNSMADFKESWIWVKKEDFKQYAFPRLIEKYCVNAFY